MCYDIPKRKAIVGNNPRNHHRRSRRHFVVGIPIVIVLILIIKETTNERAITSNTMYNGSTHPSITQKIQYLFSLVHVRQR